MKPLFSKHNISIFLKSNNGFTLIEIVVIDAILAILTAVAAPKVAGIIDSAKSGTDITNLRTLNNATVMYEVSKGSQGGDVFEEITTD